MKRLVVISGPANSGKMPLARRLCVNDPRLLLVHRDHIREGLINEVAEGTITHLMAEMAKRLLNWDYSVCACAWNLEHTDHLIWDEVALETGATLEWLDVREPDVAALIPPMGKLSSE
jgi:hypothetical protein